MFRFFTMFSVESISEVESIKSRRSLAKILARYTVQIDLKRLLTERGEEYLITYSKIQKWSKGLFLSRKLSATRCKRVFEINSSRNLFNKN